MTELFTAIEKRRSIYDIGAESPIDDERIKEIIRHSIKHTPTAFNSQNGRVILLLNEENNKFWDITLEELEKIVPEENFSKTKEKVEGFKAGHGTVLFFEEMKTVKDLQKKFPLYSDNFSVWSKHSIGMLQYIIWTSLRAEDLGASLQHYTEVIKDRVYEEWDINEDWKLVAQMPFGKILTEAGEKEFMPMGKRLKIYE
ncbi:MAG TPA: nitroreductase family protein [Clostridia bacterium]|nr:nitroreductase family protein [Clostridia bacterium]